jgi:uncharacterized protein YndB with AHSA1/START domain
MSQSATATRTREIIVDEVLPHAPEVVWKTLTTPGLIGRWLMEPKGFAAAPGTRFSFQTTPGGAWDGVIHCEVIEVQAPERLVYSWASGHEANETYGSKLDTVVTWTLEREGEGTRLRLVQSGFEFPRNEAGYANLSSGWPVVMKRIDQVSGE